MASLTRRLDEVTDIFGFRHWPHYNYETTILRFRHLLRQHGLTRAIFDEIGGLLEARGLLLRRVSEISCSESYNDARWAGGSAWRRTKNAE